MLGGVSGTDFLKFFTFLGIGIGPNFPIREPKGRRKEEGVWGTGALHPLIGAKAESPRCLKEKIH